MRTGSTEKAKSAIGGITAVEELPETPESDTPGSHKTFNCTNCDEPAPEGTAICPHCLTAVDSRQGFGTGVDAIRSDYSPLRRFPKQGKISDRFISHLINLGVFGTLATLPSGFLFLYTKDGPILGERIIRMLRNHLENDVYNEAPLPILLILFLLFEIFSWQRNPGKTLTGLVVADRRKGTASGSLRIGFWRNSLRCLLKWTLSIPSLAVLPFSREKIWLHDRILDTRVVQNGFSTNPTDSGAARPVGLAPRLLSNLVLASILGGLLVLPNPYQLQVNSSDWATPIAYYVWNIEFLEKNLQGWHWFAIPILFLMAIEILVGNAHPGRKLYGLKLIDTRKGGALLGFWKNAVRSLIKWTLSIPAALPILFFRERFWLHDIILGTQVVEMDKSGEYHP